MSTIAFQAQIFTADPEEKIASGVMVSIPKDVSAQLPSRGMVMVKGTLNGREFCTHLEPDGDGSHWFQVTPTLLKSADAKPGDTASVAFEPLKEWPEPKVPSDFQQALDADEAARSVWQDITPAARWDWIRWIGATRNPATRQKRIEVGCSKLTSGKRRPCCFDRSQCTLTDA